MFHTLFQKHLKATQCDYYDNLEGLKIVTKLIASLLDFSEYDLVCDVLSTFDVYTKHMNYHYAHDCKQLIENSITWSLIPNTEKSIRVKAKYDSMFKYITTPSTSL